MKRTIKRVRAFNAQTTTAVSEAINVTDFKEVAFVHSTIASSNQVVKVQGAISTSENLEPVAPDFSATRAVGNEWDFVESLDYNDPSTPVTGDGGVTFTGADVRQFIINVELLDWISFEISVGTAGALTTNVLLSNNS